METLKRLEATLESFLERAIFVKAERIGVLRGINRLDDIARKVVDGDDLTDAIGRWFAEHNRLLSENRLTPAEQNRISGLLGEIRRELRVNEDSSPAVYKIAGEIERWRGGPKSTGIKLVLKRGPESAGPTDGEPTIAKFASELERISAVYADVSAGKKHVLSVLDDSLKSAILQKNHDALILSGLLIYYLKLSGYKVEPFVKRLKEAEAIQRQDVTHA
jgi:hypothetical protein